MEKGLCLGLVLEEQIQGFGVYQLQVWRACSVWLREVVEHGPDWQSSRMEVLEERYWGRECCMAWRKMSPPHFWQACPLPT